MPRYVKSANIFSTALLVCHLRLFRSSHLDILVRSRNESSVGSVTVMISISSANPRSSLISRPELDPRPDTLEPRMRTPESSWSEYRISIIATAERKVANSILEEKRQGPLMPPWQALKRILARIKMFSFQFDYGQRRVM